MTNLEKYLYQLRRIEKHREAQAEKEIRKLYKEILKELNGFLGNIYATYSEDDMLTYALLAKAGADARFMEEVEQRINSISPKVAKEIQETVQQTYEACYDGMRNAVVKAAGNRELLQQAFASVSAVTPDVIKQAVNNPVSGLTLKDTLEKHRKEIIYDIKQNIGVGLTNGDRYSTMAKRIAESLDGDYKKAIRIARTETHRVRESGFNDAATAINDTLKQGTSGYVMAKTWRTMQDERVRPLKAKGKSKKYNHVKMDGVTIPQDELFVLPSGAKCTHPSKTGVAGEDINCRCYLSYDLVLASELTKVQDGTKTIEKAAKVEQEIDVASKINEYETKIDAAQKEYKQATLEYMTTLDGKAMEKAQNAKQKADLLKAEYDTFKQKYEKEISALQNLTKESTVINPITTKKEVKGTLTQLGFTSVDDRIMVLNDEVLVDTTNQLISLEKKFGVIKQGKVNVTVTKERKAKASVASFSGDSKTQELRLTQYFKKTKRDIIDDLAEEIENNFKMPVSFENYSKYTITHEYGHMLQNILLGEKYNKLSPLMQRELERDGLKLKLWRDEQAAKIRLEIVGIAKEMLNDMHFLSYDYVSDYGKTNNFEFFAEIFANSQLGEPNILGRAMNEWLNRKGLILE